MVTLYRRSRNAPGPQRIKVAKSSENRLSKGVLSSKEGLAIPAAFTTAGAITRNEGVNANAIWAPCYDGAGADITAGPRRNEDALYEITRPVAAGARLRKASRGNLHPHRSPQPLNSFWYTNH